MQLTHRHTTPCTLRKVFTAQSPVAERRSLPKKPKRVIHYYEAFWNPGTLFSATVLGVALAAIIYAARERARTGASQGKLWLGVIASLLLVCALSFGAQTRDVVQITMTDDYVSCITWTSTDDRRIELPWSHVSEVTISSRSGSRRHRGPKFLDFGLTAEGRALPWKNQSFVSSAQARCPIDWLEASPTDIQREAVQRRAQCESRSCRFGPAG
jgi:hypothetical protein